MKIIIILGILMIVLAGSAMAAPLYSGLETKDVSSNPPYFNYYGDACGATPANWAAMRTGNYAGTCQQLNDVSNVCGTCWGPDFLPCMIIGGGIEISSGTQLDIYATQAECLAFFTSGSGYCGDGTCNIGEDTENCTYDCGGPAVFTGLNVNTFGISPDYYDYLGDMCGAGPGNWIKFTSGTLTGNCYEIDLPQFVCATCWNPLPCVGVVGGTPAGIGNGDSFEVHVSESVCTGSIVYEEGYGEGGPLPGEIPEFTTIGLLVAVALAAVGIAFVVRKKKK